MEQDAKNIIEGADLGQNVRSARVAKVASLVASGLKKGEIAEEMGVKNPSNLVKRAHESGLVAGIQAKQIEKAMDLNATRKRIAENCLRAMETGSEMILEEIEDIKVVNEGATEEEKQEVPIPKLKMVKDMLDSTEYSGRKLDRPEQEQPGAEELDNGVAEAVKALKKVASEAGVDINIRGEVPENSGSEDSASDPHDIKIVH